MANHSIGKLLTFPNMKEERTQAADEAMRIANSVLNQLNLEDGPERITELEHHFKKHTASAIRFIREEADIIIVRMTDEGKCTAHFMMAIEAAEMMADIFEDESIQLSDKMTLKIARVLCDLASDLRES
jgi:hypothetical protein